MGKWLVIHSGKTESLMRDKNRIKKEFPTTGAPVSVEGWKEVLVRIFLPKPGKRALTLYPSYPEEGEGGEEERERERGQREEDDLTPFRPYLIYPESSHETYPLQPEPELNSVCRPHPKSVSRILFWCWEPGHSSPFRTQ